MARIRSIKPEFWTSEQIVECSTSARLLFVGLWNFCDDGGRHPAKAKQVKMEVFPGDDFTTDQVQGWLDELIEQGLLEPYEVDGNAYWQVTGWHHQKIDRPNFKHPEPPKIRRSIDDNSTNSVTDDSTSARRVIAEQSPPEGKGRERKGEKNPLNPPSQGEKKKSSRGQRLPDDWVLPDTWSAEAKRIARDMRADVSVDLEADKFRDYWHGVNGAKGVKLDWQATWRNWIRSACEKKPAAKPKRAYDPMRGAL